MAYVTNKDWEELQLVSPANRARYENELKILMPNLRLSLKDQMLTRLFMQLMEKHGSEKSNLILLSH